MQKLHSKNFAKLTHIFLKQVENFRVTLHPFNKSRIFICNAPFFQQIKNFRKMHPIFFNEPKICKSYTLIFLTSREFCKSWATFLFKQAKNYAKTNDYFCKHIKNLQNETQFLLTSPETARYAQLFNSTRIYTKAWTKF